MVGREILTEFFYLGLFSVLFVVDNGLSLKKSPNRELSIGTDRGLDG